ncbi:MAG: YkgJ family cysteine cluster protein [Flavobacteriales bacterium]|nr:YkgJ family cysteine cluster protein [Flavobacteriales bacterium]
MNSLPAKVKAVKKVYERLDREIAQLQRESGLHCLSGCGECCKKADIEATPLEFLPLALQFFDEGRAEQVLEELNQSQDPLCYVFRPHVTNFGGLCNEYPNRGLICRLFGFTARRNKEGDAELVTCKLIKEHQQSLYETLIAEIKSGKKIPVMSEYYTRVTSIDPGLTQFYPINQAMAKAIETVLHYYAYRKRRKPKS